MSSSENSETPQSNAGIGFWIALIVLIFLTIVSYFTILQVTSVTTSQQQSNIPCTNNIGQLPSVTSSQFQPCYDINGNLNGQYYDIINNWTIINLTGQAIPSASSICLEFCPLLTLPDDCVSQDSQYSQCLSSLTPTNCTDPALPVARDGINPYYVLGRGFNSCYPPPS